jgi:cupin superfamily acireductone dioxygenase involved in methionine salvage
MEYQSFVCEGITYLILTFEETSKGYLTLICEKAKKHSFYDSCNVSRMVEYRTDSGATRERLELVLNQIPCELIRLVSGSTNKSEQEQDLTYRFELHLENQHGLKAGDELEITHKSDVYKAIVQNYFRTHTHQIIELLMEAEA